MSLVFHYAPMSSAVTVHWALEELGVPYEKVKIDLAARDQDRPAFLALNPNGKVPLLVHDGTPIFESVAIMTHLGETFGVQKRLFPEPGLKRAEVMKWLVWCNVSLGEALSRWLHNTSPRIPAERHNAKAAEVAKADVEKHLGILDSALEGRSWLVTDSFGLVDLHVSGWVAYVGMCGFDLARWPKVDAWVKKAAARPSYAAAMTP
ncbi:MAG: glutathione S-transferase family protein [Labilithrix sp.]|nr:glutathione S-transferase family protein [Labilithrix sp.]